MRTTNIEIICDRNGESVSISDIRPSIIVGFGLHHTWTFYHGFIFPIHQKPFLFRLMLDSSPPDSLLPGSVLFFH